MEWSEIMGKRDRLAQLLRPHLGKEAARERANDIIQVLMCGEDDPSVVALRMLARDLEPRAAEVVAYQLGRAWEAPAPAPQVPAPYRGLLGAETRGVSRRKRRETIILGLWN